MGYHYVWHEICPKLGQVLVIQSFTNRQLGMIEIAYNSNNQLGSDLLSDFLVYV